MKKKKQNKVINGDNMRLATFVFVLFYHWLIIHSLSRLGFSVRYVASYNERYVDQYREKIPLTNLSSDMNLDMASIIIIGAVRTCTLNLLIAFN